MVLACASAGPPEARKRGMEPGENHKRKEAEENRRREDQESMGRSGREE